MFTGLVMGQGDIIARKTSGQESLISVKPRFNWAEPLVLGESISVSGICLTVNFIDQNVFSAYASRETMGLTTLGTINEVNLERALKLSDRLGGHLVSGHIDGLGHIQNVSKKGSSLEITTRVPPEIGCYIVNKGSITLDGVSLTVNTCGTDWFTVNVIPQTRQATTLSGKKTGTPVNLETDILAKYMEKILMAGKIFTGEKLESLEAGRKGPKTKAQSSLRLEDLIKNGF